MKKIYLLTIIMFAFQMTWAQNSGWHVPDSAANIVKPGSGPMPVWTGTGELTHNGTMYMPGPTSPGFINNASDWLYLYNTGINVPLNATITGVEAIIGVTGCNSGDYHMDTFALAYNGDTIGMYKTDSVPAAGSLDTFGSAVDTWSTSFTPAMVNSDSFGLFYSFVSYGTCTILVYDCKLRVHYTLPTGIKGVAESNSTGIYPNPASNEVIIYSQDNTIGSQYSVYDQAGKEVRSGRIKDKHTAIDIRALPAGIYYIKQPGDVPVSKFLKQ